MEAKALIMVLLIVCLVAPKIEALDAVSGAYKPTCGWSICYAECTPYHSKDDCINKCKCQPDQDSPPSKTTCGRSPCYAECTPYYSKDDCISKCKCQPDQDSPPSKTTCGRSPCYAECTPYYSRRRCRKKCDCIPDKANGSGDITEYYCNLGCASSLCQNFKIDGAGEGKGELEQAVKHCNSGCYEICNKASKLQVVA